MMSYMDDPITVLDSRKRAVEEAKRYEESTGREAKVKMHLTEIAGKTRRQWGIYEVREGE